MGDFSFGDYVVLRPCRPAGGHGRCPARTALWAAIAVTARAAVTATTATWPLIAAEHPAAAGGRGSGAGGGTRAQGVDTPAE